MVKSNKTIEAHHAEEITITLYSLGNTIKSQQIRMGGGREVVKIFQRIRPMN